MPDPRFDLTGRTILITGSTRGLGWGMARGLAEAGARVVLNGTNQELLRARVEELTAAGAEARAAAFDVRDEEGVGRAIAEIAASWGPLDGVVNNAGINRRGPLLDFAPEDFQAVLDINLLGVWRVARHAARGMIARRRGKIINIGSITEFGGRATIGPYIAAKAAVSALTRTMAVEWGPHNIQVNAIAPGYFETDLNRVLKEDAQFDAWVRSKTPAERWGQPEELIGIAIFLASRASDYVNGQTIRVDGGWTAKL
ncbi:MAG: Gluconate 5-dehydrogenase [candidate division BRC1 bacterium ADurb.BinA292]|nr:MAG: Gluconate 5-dehydrogenase [candidate division BRC1 bacterium ADurb.BinA292]